MKAYSIDLRMRILAFLNAGHSIRETAQHFFVSPDCVFRLKKRYEQTQSVLPKQQGGSMKPKIDAEGEVFLQQRLSQNNSLTLVELCELYQQERRVSVQKSAMHRTLKRLGITFKKKLPRRYSTERAGAKTDRNLSSDLGSNRSRPVDLY